MRCANIKVNKAKYLTKMYHCTVIKIIVVHAVVQAKALIINNNIPFVPLYHNNYIYNICERKNSRVYIWEIIVVQWYKPP